MPPHRMVSSQFWTGETGRLLRQKPSDTKVTAFYLMTSPHAHMCGLYYVPLPFVVHETGLERKAIDDSLDILRDLQFAFYDHGTEFVWVKEMAHWQLDAPLKPRDSRIPTVQRWYAALPPNIFLGAFHDRYCQELQLSERRGSPLVPPEPPINPPSTPRPRGADAPTSPIPIPDPIPSPEEGGVGGTKIIDFEAAFEERWLRYPVKDGKKEARRHWSAHVTTEDALRDFDTALDNYMQHLKITGYTPKNGSTYFNNWHDYINWQEPSVPLGVNRNGQREHESNGERLIRKQHEESERARDVLRRTTGHGPGTDHPDGPGDPLRRSIAGSH